MKSYWDDKEHVPRACTNDETGNDIVLFCRTDPVIRRLMMERRSFVHALYHFQLKFLLPP